MKVKWLFLGAVLLFSACRHNNEPQEKYDVVSVTEYKNSYDEDGRLTEVQIAETTDMLHGRDNSGAFIVTFNSLRKYTYNSDTDYLIMEFADMLREVKTIKYSGNTKEELWLENGNDTTVYTFERYYDKGKLEYEKHITKSHNTPSDEWRSETFYYYDKNGCLIKTVDHDLNTGVKTERYFFEDITYDEALRSMPASKYKPKIVCKVKDNSRDTLITRTITDGLLSKVCKEYRDNGLKVHVSRMMGKSGYWVDSIYYKGDKKVRTTKVDSTDVMKMLVTSEYDGNGNLIREVNKTKFSDKSSSRNDL